MSPSFSSPFLLGGTISLVLLLGCPLLLQGCLQCKLSGEQLRLPYSKHAPTHRQESRPPNLRALLHSCPSSLERTFLPRQEMSASSAQTLRLRLGQSSGFEAPFLHLLGQVTFGKELNLRFSLL